MWRVVCELPPGLLQLALVQLLQFEWIYISIYLLALGSSLFAAPVWRGADAVYAVAYLVLC